MPNEKGEYKGKLNVSGLAASGMMINGVLLIDILNQAGKISLSGGSYQLNGIVKKADKDAKQWKLIVDGNEIKNEDIFLYHDFFWYFQKRDEVSPVTPFLKISEIPWLSWKRV